MIYIIESDINEEFVLENYSSIINLDHLYHDKDLDKYKYKYNNYTYIVFDDDEYWYESFIDNTVIDNYDAIIMGEE